MRGFKFLIVFAIGLIIELFVASISFAFILSNIHWLDTLTFPFFATKSPLIWGILLELSYLFTAGAFGFYASEKSSLPKGCILLFCEGISQIVFCLFFFTLAYEIVSFFVATIELIFTFATTMIFLKKSDLSGALMLLVFTINVYAWAILYCIIMLNFT